MSENNDITRRQWLKRMAAAAVAPAVAAAFVSCRRSDGDAVTLSASPGNANEPFDAGKIIAALPEHIDCVRCGACMPCGYGVDIPAMLTAYNDALGRQLIPKSAAEFSSPDGLRRSREFLAGIERSIGDKHIAHRCALCGFCQKKCPMDIKIAAQMGRIGKFIDLIREQT